MSLNQSWPVRWPEKSWGFFDEGKVLQDDSRGKSPIKQHRETFKWGFFDEVGADSFGPFDTTEDAESACAEYARTL